MHHHQQQLRVTVINHESSFAAQILRSSRELVSDYCLDNVHWTQPTIVTKIVHMCMRACVHGRFYQPSSVPDVSAASS